MRTLACSFAALATLAAATGTADAKCMSWPAWDGSAGSGVTALPPNPILYAFLPPHIAEDSKVGIDLFAVRTPSGKRANATVSEIPSSRGSDLRVYRIQVDRKVHGPIVFLGRRYRIVDAWGAPDARLEMRNVHTVKDEWSCSYTDIVSASPSVGGDAAAYQIRWNDFVHGEQTQIVPVSMSFPETGPSAAELQLGHVSCFGVTADLSDASDVWVTALYADGSESSPVPLWPTTSPPIVKPAPVPAFTPPPPAPAPRDVAAPPPPPSSRFAGGIVLFMLGMLLGAAWSFARRAYVPWAPMR